MTEGTSGQPSAPDEPAGAAPEATTGADEARPEREKGDAEPVRRRRRPRRAVRGGTNPSAEDLPDVVAPRDEAAPGETQHDRWLREQRPPHWE